MNIYVQFHVSECTDLIHIRNIKRKMCVCVIYIYIYIYVYIHVYTVYMYVHIYTDHTRKGNLSTDATLKHKVSKNVAVV